MPSTSTADSTDSNNNNGRAPPGDLFAVGSNRHLQNVQSKKKEAIKKMNGSSHGGKNRADNRSTTIQSASESSSSSSLAPPKRPTWAPSKVFVVPPADSNDSGNNSASSHSTAENEIQVPPSPKHLNAESSKAEWNRLILAKQLQPHRLDLAKSNPNLPNTLQELTDADDYDFTENPTFQQMMQDPSLSDREALAFWEGYQLSQLQVQSLQTQLDGWKAKYNNIIYFTSHVAKTSNHPGGASTSRPSPLASMRSQSILPISKYSTGINNRSSRLISTATSTQYSAAAPTNTAAARTPFLKSSSSFAIGSSPAKNHVSFATRKAMPPTMPSVPSTPVTTPQPVTPKRMPSQSRRRGLQEEDDDDDAGLQQLRSPSVVKSKFIHSNIDNNNDERIEDNNDDDVDQPTELPTRSIRSFGPSTRALSIQRIKRHTVVAPTDDANAPLTAAKKGSDDATTAAADNAEETRIQKLLEELEQAEKRQRKLEQQLAQAGVVIAEDIPYELAKQKVQETSMRMGELSELLQSESDDKQMLEREYFEMEREFEKYITALQLTDEWIQEQRQQEEQWEEDVREGNIAALRAVRSHMPVDIRNSSEQQLMQAETPNGTARLSKMLVQKMKRTNVLQLIRTDPRDILKLHPASLETMRLSNLTLTERRALHQHLEPIAGREWKKLAGNGKADPLTERKWTWYSMMKSNFKEKLLQWERHVEQYGDSSPHTCPLLGKQCPVRVNQNLDYFAVDYGYPKDDVYFSSGPAAKPNDNNSNDSEQLVASAKKQQAKDKLALERTAALKQHYKNKILQVSLANGVCETMDTVMDTIEEDYMKWIVQCAEYKNKPSPNAITKDISSYQESLNTFKLSLLQFVDRSGMPIMPRRMPPNAEGDENDLPPDPRSAVEIALCQEVMQMANDMILDGIEEFMKDVYNNYKDGRLESSIQQCRKSVQELQDRNENSLQQLQVAEVLPSRDLKTRAMLKEEFEKKRQQETNVKEESDQGRKDTIAEAKPKGPFGGGDARGGLLDAIQGKGKGGRGGGGGRGGLLGAIQGRSGGRGSRGGGSGGDRGGLLGAIQGRGGGGGSGGLLDAIKKKDTGGDAGGRGGLLAAIAARAEKS